MTDLGYVPLCIAVIASFAQVCVHARDYLGTWHKVSVKHLPAYLQEMTWRFNNRKNKFLFRDTLIQMLKSDNLEYKELTKVA